MTDPLDLYTETCFKCSKVITHQYSTSFGMGIRTFDPNYRYAIYGIYGFVRYADEIVDTFHDHDRAALIAKFKQDTFTAIDQRISLNPVLHAFQYVVNRYGLQHDLISAFLTSMETDLVRTDHTQDSYETYIYGSAEVVGLMCLQVFCDGDTGLYNELLPNARSLGAAFQKVNFLRDVRSDLEERGRTYFPGVDLSRFTQIDKEKIEADIDADLNKALAGIKRLPKTTRLGVYVAYVYYRQLLKKIKQNGPEAIFNQRIRVNDVHKTALYVKAVIKQRLNVI